MIFYQNGFKLKCDKCNLTTEIKVYSHADAVKAMATLGWRSVIISQEKLDLCAQCKNSSELKSE